jgi:hypothetical protein
MPRDARHCRSYDRRAGRDSGMTRSQTMKAENHICCLCGVRFWGMGHNPAPLDSDPARCCTDCNGFKVIPARMAALGIGTAGLASLNPTKESDHDRDR